MQTKKKSQLEFIFIMAALMSLVALSIDALLPALQQIGISVGFKSATDNQLLITMIFLGLGFGQLISGPLSDSFGRKPIVYVGFGVFVLSSFICVFATSLEMMVVGRILQGIGLSAPRTLSIAMVRDTYSGDYMAKMMSFIVSIFILVPVVAPTLGKLILDSYGWQSIFISQLVFGLVIMIWFWKRQPETLKKEHKKAFSFDILISGTKEFFKHKEAILYTLLSGFITGCFMVFLGTAQHIFQVQYNLVEEFPFIFGALAISVGFSTFVNGTIVLRFGMKKIVVFFLTLFTVISLLYVFFFFGKENPSITILVLFFSIQFFAIGFLFGNLRALAMQPLGHIAGVGSAINGFISTVMAVPIATYIGSFVTTKALPLFIGFSIFGILSLIMLKTLRKTTYNGIRSPF
jgi:DHA1 family bicyclomycin/chloramphenicol resistance-like MFS transporter